MPSMKTRVGDLNKTPQQKIKDMTMKNEYPLMRGIVEQNDDPKGVGRVKVRISAIHGTQNNGMTTEQLPWAVACMPNASYNSGTFIVPEVGNVVMCGFEDGDTSKIVYFGGLYGIGVTDVKTVGNTGGEVRYQRLGKCEVPDEVMSVEDKMIYKSPKGANILIKDKRGEESVVIEDQLGQTIKMKAPFNDKVSIASLENVDNSTRMKDEASIEMETVNGSCVKVVSKKDNTELEVALKGEKEVSIKVNTEKGLDIIVGKYAIKVDESVRIETETEKVEISDNELILKAKTVRVVAEDLYLGE